MPIILMGNSSIFGGQKMTNLDHFIQFEPILDHFRPFWMGTLSKVMVNFKIPLAKALLVPTDASNGPFTIFSQRRG